MAGQGGYGVNPEELRARGGELLGVSDALDATAAKGVMLAHGAYGVTGGFLDGRASRFADRFTYLLGKLGEEADELGESMRASAAEYAEVDSRAAEAHQAIAHGLE